MNKGQPWFYSVRIYRLSNKHPVWTGIAVNPLHPHSISLDLITFKIISSIVPSAWGVYFGAKMQVPSSKSQLLNLHRTHPFNLEPQDRKKLVGIPQLNITRLWRHRMPIRRRPDHILNGMFITVEQETTIIRYSANLLNDQNINRIHSYNRPAYKLHIPHRVNPLYTTALLASLNRRGRMRDVADGDTNPSSEMVSAHFHTATNTTTNINTATNTNANATIGFGVGVGVGVVSVGVISVKQKDFERDVERRGEGGEDEDEEDEWEEDDWGEGDTEKRENVKEAMSSHPNTDSEVVSERGGRRGLSNI
ncbi:hypothetical protein JR316_0007557 [Psilocybe cubensis]|uniref:Uncharacterized protein n=1 Tax=Psilocybe cubensis TaxID=181762 RepID=A0ACB8H180_PSICU|nr:hypothetical protein JR316_0007557 [Psilocybe cubensis]KAH9480950.1 hypothetical protein JR316_0007557 [Psilocybe cubensis]